MSEAVAPTPVVVEGDRFALWLDRNVPTGWRALLVVALVHVIAALLAFDPTPQASGDNAAYHALAEALATGRGYVRLWEPTQPPETLYPPVFPLLIAAAMRLGVQSWAALHLLMICFSAAFVCASYGLLRRVVSPAQAFVCSVAVALSPALLDASHALLSDVPFAALTAAALWAFATLDAGDRHDAARERWLVAVGLVATVLAYFTRSAGLPLVIAAFAWLLWKRRLVVAGILGAMVVPLAIAWSARARHQGGAYTDFLRYIDPYQPELGRVDAVDVLVRMFSNLDLYASRHLPSLLYGGTDGFAAFGGWICVILAVIGYWFRVRRPSVSELWVPLYLGLLLLWPAAWSGDRLLLPMYPLLLAYAVLALPLTRVFLPRPVVVCTLVIAGIGLLSSDVQRARRGVHCTSAYRRGTARPCVENGWGDFTDLSMRLRGRLPDSSVILSRKPTILYAESGYRSLMYPLSSAPDTFFAEARRAGARYVVVDVSTLANLYLFPALRTHPNRFCTLPDFQRIRASLMRIEPEGAQVSTSTAGDIKPCP